MTPTRRPRSRKGSVPELWPLEDKTTAVPAPPRMEDASAPVDAPSGSRAATPTQASAAGSGASRHAPDNSDAERGDQHQDAMDAEDSDMWPSEMESEADDGEGGIYDEAIDRRIRDKLNIPKDLDTEQYLVQLLTMQGLDGERATIDAFVARVLELKDPNKMYRYGQRRPAGSSRSRKPKPAPEARVMQARKARAMAKGNIEAHYEGERRKRKPKE